MFFFSGHPYPPENCTIKDGPKIEMQLVCTPNYNGGLKQSFVLEVSILGTMKMASMMATQKPPIALAQPQISVVVSESALNFNGDDTDTKRNKMLLVLSLLLSFVT